MVVEIYQSEERIPADGFTKMLYRNAGQARYGSPPESKGI
jgi:hypothetical protein